MLTRTSKSSKTTSAATVHSLPDWRDDAKLRQLHELIARGQSGLPDVEQRARDLQAQIDQASAAYGVASINAQLGDGDPAALAAQAAEVDALVKDLRETEQAAATIRMGVENARAALPAVEAKARAKVQDEMRRVYREQAETFTAALEAAVEQLTTLLRLHDAIRAQFPNVETIDGELVLDSLGMPRPNFPELREPAGQQFYGQSPVYWWRQAMRQLRGEPAS